jgi:hypothetical protein
VAEALPQCGFFVDNLLNIVSPPQISTENDIPVLLQKSERRVNFAVPKWETAASQNENDPNEALKVLVFWLCLA